MRVHKENKCLKPAMAMMQLPDQLRLEVTFFLTEIKMAGFDTSPILTSGRRRDEQLCRREQAAHLTNVSGIFNETSDFAQKNRDELDQYAS